MGLIIYYFWENGVQHAYYRGKLTASGEFYEAIRNHFGLMLRNPEIETTSKSILDFKAGSVVVYEEKGVKKIGILE